MKENVSTTYTCDICGQAWALKEFAEKCEAIGYPENYNKLLGKWIVVPTSVYFSNEKSNNSFDFSPEKLWRVVRIDSNYITNLVPNFAMPTGVTNGPSVELAKEYGDRLLALNHKLVVTCKGFEDNSRVESLKEFLPVPEMMWAQLNEVLVKLELDRAEDKKKANIEYRGIITPYVAQFFTSKEFEALQHKTAETMLKDVIYIAGLELPEIEKEELPSIMIQTT